MDETTALLGVRNSSCGLIETVNEGRSMHSTCRTHSTAVQHTFFLPKVWTACVVGAILSEVGQAGVVGCCMLEEGREFSTGVGGAIARAKCTEGSSEVVGCNPTGFLVLAPGFARRHELTRPVGPFCSISAP